MAIIGAGHTEPLLPQTTAARHDTIASKYSSASSSNISSANSNNSTHHTYTAAGNHGLDAHVSWDTDGWDDVNHGGAAAGAGSSSSVGIDNDGGYLGEFSNGTSAGVAVTTGAIISGGNIRSHSDGGGPVDRVALIKARQEENIFASMERAYVAPKQVRVAPPPVPKVPPHTAANMKSSSSTSQSHSSSFEIPKGGG